MSNVQVSNEAIVPNAKRLLFAGFMAILAAGMGFAIRGGIFNDWVQAFNFTGLEIGLINGAGFTGFCFGIIIGGVIVDKIGYGKLVAAAFAFHVVSALVAFGAMPGMATKTAFVYLWTGTCNGLSELENSTRAVPPAIDFLRCAVFGSAFPKI